jgi:hypothetical protein
MVNPNNKKTLMIEGLIFTYIIIKWLTYRETEFHKLSYQPLPDNSSRFLLSLISSIILRC